MHILTEISRRLTKEMFGCYEHSEETPIELRACMNVSASKEELYYSDKSNVFEKNTPEKAS